MGRVLGHPRRIEANPVDWFAMGDPRCGTCEGAFCETSTVPFLAVDIPGITRGRQLSENLGGEVIRETVKVDEASGVGVKVNRLAEEDLEG